MAAYKVANQDPRGAPALSLFLWEDGAPWDWLMNYFMNDPFPAAPDPTVLNPLFGNGSSIEAVQKAVQKRLEASR